MAAYLERVAKAQELAELNHRLDGSNRCVTCGHWRNDHAMDLVGEHFCEHGCEGGTGCDCNCKSYVGVVAPSYTELVAALRGVAAALAACAREAKLDEAKWWFQPERHIAHADGTCDCHEMAVARIAALERAVGEKG